MATIESKLDSSINRIIFNRALFVLIIILSSSMSGCVGKLMYPITKNNILTTPIQVSLPATDGAVKPEKKAFVSQVLSGAESYLYDDLGKTKSVEFIEKRFREEYEGKIPDDSSRIKEALRQSLERRQIFSFLGNEYSARTNLDNITLDWSGDDGTVKARASAQIWSGGFNNVGTTDVQMNLRRHITDDKISFDVSSLSYVMNCVYGNYNTTCMPFEITMNDKELINSIKNSSSPPPKTATADDIRSELVSRLIKRFQITEKQAINKNEQTYKVNFETAKSRLQRKLDNFQYDDKTSAFRFNLDYANPMNKNSMAKHVYVLSMFPDNNDTVVVFSGDYQSFKDALGGPDLFSRDVYNEKMNEYVNIVRNLLKK